MNECNNNLDEFPNYYKNIIFYYVGKGKINASYVGELG